MTDKAKVLIVVNDLLLGGAQRIILDLIRDINHSEFDVVVVGLKSPGVFSKESSITLHHEIESSGARVIFLSDQRRAAFKEFVRLVRFIRAERPDIVHTFLPYAGVIGRVAARIGGVRHVVSTQCNVPVAYSFKEYWLDRITLFLAEAWTAAAEAIEMQYGGSVAYISDLVWGIGRRHFTIVAGVNRKRIEEIAGNIDRAQKRAQLGINPDEIMILMTARLISWKGHADVIQSLPFLPHKVQVCFAGWGTLQESLLQMAKDLKVDARVHFLGARNDIYELLGAADIFVQPFGRDAQGNMWMGPNTSVMEACAAGVPVVTTKVPLIESLVEDGVTGTLAGVNDPKSLADSIQWVIDHKAETRNRAVLARARVQERYSVEAMIQNYTMLYQNMLKLS